MARATPKRIKALVSKVKAYGGSADYDKTRMPAVRKARAWNIRQNRIVARAKHPHLKGIELSKKGNMMRP